MFRNYLKVALRNIRKNKLFSAINIAGLAIGMAACLLILQYVSFELSFDQFHKQVKDIYRVANDRYQNGRLIQHGTITYSAVGKAMNDDFEEVVENVRVNPIGEQIVIWQNKKLSIDAIVAVDNNFLTMFSFPLLAGDVSNALTAPRAIVLSETVARKIFDYKGNDFSQFIGKGLIINRDSSLYKVTAIAKDVPENSHLRFNILLAYSTLYTSWGWKQSDYDFTDSDFWHYVRLKPGTDYKKLNARLDAFSEKHFQGNKISGSNEKFFLQPLSRAHLYSDFEYEIGQTSSATVVWSLLTIALFIIVIAWVNYINLATARSVERAKEVGIRKVVGGVKRQLISQFLTESVIINLMSIGLALGLVLLAQHGFNNLLKHELSLSYLVTKGLSGQTIFIGLMVLIVTGIFLSGFYPAFVLSAFKPISVLKGKLSNSKKGIFFRKSLVVGQFSITVALIIGSVVVVNQLRYMNKKDLGFNMDQVLVIRSPNLTAWDSTYIDRANTFKSSLKQIAGVQAATTSWSVPGGELGRSFNVRRADSSNATKYTVRHTAQDYDFLKVYGLKLVAGRYFEPIDHNPNPSKLHNLVINQSCAKLLGFTSPENAVGKSIMRGDRKWDVIGVIEDYHQKSLRYPLEPMLIMPFYSTGSEISVKLNHADITKTVAAIKKQYDAFYPGNLFDYFFLDERFNRQYQDDQLFGEVFGIFSGFAILIACLGLFGLSLFATIQRTKEIGVRKVLGASVSNIIVLLSGDFLKLVLIANGIAFPVAWWVMNNWLKDFAYRTDISWWIFAVSGILALAIALITISFQAVKAALSNPTKSLRTE